MNAAAPLHSPEAARQAGRDWLSLALIDSRNTTLRWLARFESAGALFGGPTHRGVPWDLVASAGWVQAQLLARAAPHDTAHDAAQGPAVSAGQAVPKDALSEAAQRAAWADQTQSENGTPDPQRLRAALQAGLEQGLDSLADTPETDAELAVFRQALAHEDGLALHLCVAAQWLGVDPGDAAAPAGPPPARGQREALYLPATRFQWGSDLAGYAPPGERKAQTVDVPDFEIDAQVLSWQAFVEFAQDGGYDNAAWWTPEGWAWAQAKARRAPRGVAQLRGAVLLHRFGRLQQAPAAQAAAHVSFHEAQAWCRWAQRRLPTEVEWELAACAAASRGFVWGDVLEWTAGTAGAWTGAGVRAATGADPGAATGTAISAETANATPAPALRVLRGAASWSAPRQKHVKARHFAEAEADALFCGLRSCARV